LTHHLLGVSREHLLDDYLATNHALDFDRRLPRLIQDLAEQAGREPTPEAARLAMGVEAAYLHTAFAAIEDAHGDLDGYLTEALRVDTASRARIRSRLIG
jgi:protein tyrosine/serine phosphatase